MIDECDIELSKRLRSILSVQNLVEQRNDFEQRICMYFDSNIRDQNVIQCRKYCHSLLEKIQEEFAQEFQNLVHFKAIEDMQPDAVGSLINIFNKIIVTYNLLCPKNIPYRSEAITDYLQANILDELH